MKKIDLNNKTVLVTGAAGFIGAALVRRLMEEAEAGCIIGIDDMNDYYDPELKRSRVEKLRKADGPFVFLEMSINDRDGLEDIFRKYAPDVVVNLAAQAGVRYSIDNPYVYLSSNVIGFFNIIECCRHYPVEHLVFASSSSVYGSNKDVPYRTEDKTDTPVSLYAATKKCDEVLAYAYSELYGIPSTALRFFTVYGPEGRPDMAYFSFADKLKAGGTIQLFNHGRCERDFTYIDDIVEGVARVMHGAPEPDKENGKAAFSVYNIGNSHKVGLLEFVSILQEELVRAGVLPDDYDFESHRILVEKQPGDVEVTFSDVSALERDFGFRPGTDLRDGLRKFAEWYASYSK